MPVSGAPSHKHAALVLFPRSWGEAGEYLARVREVVAAHGGTVETRDGEVLGVFSTAPAALLAATAWRRAEAPRDPATAVVVHGRSHREVEALDELAVAGALRAAANFLAEGERLLASEAVVDATLSALPAGWRVTKSEAEIAVSPLEIDMLVAGVLPLSEEHEGRRLRITNGSDAASLELTYWREVQRPDGSGTVPVLTVAVGPLPLPLPVTAGAGTNRFGNYELCRRLGEGGMGAVWLARDAFGNLVALKQLLPQLGYSSVQLRRFRREAEVLSRLAHRHICRIHEVGESDGASYLAMEFIDGLTLAEAVAAERLPVPQASELIARVAEAVQFAHEHGVLHRDLKPANIMLRADGEPVVLDFGLAKLAEENTDLSLSLSGQIIGTIEFMAPEQAGAAGPVTERADVFSLGAILYLLLTGRKQFTASGDLLRDAERLREHQPPAPRSLNRLIERDLEIITLKALHFDPEQRYASARQLAEDLRRCSAGEPIAARRPTLHYRLEKRVRRHRVPLALAALLLVALVTLSAFWWIETGKQERDWIRVGDYDFTAPGTSLTPFEWWSAGMSTRVSPANLSSAGLDLDGERWCWLSEVRERGNVRIVAKLQTRGTSAGLLVALNSRVAPMRQGQWPAGCGFHFGANGRVDVVMRDALPHWPDAASGVRSRFRANSEFTVVCEHRDDRLTLSVDGQPAQELSELLPLRGAGLERIGFTGDCVLRSLQVFRLALPEKASPVAAGDVLLEAGHARDAIRQYLTTAENFRGRAAAPEALTKAYLTATAEAASATADEELKAWKDRAREALLREYPNHRYRHEIVEADALAAWRAGDFDHALAEAARVFSLYPETRIVPALLRTRRSPLAPPQQTALLRAVRQTRGLVAINLSNLGLTNLEELRGLPLEALECTGNQIASIEPLRGMPLRLLDISTNKVRSLEPLRGMPLDELLICELPMRSLEALRGLPLKRLEFTFVSGLSLAPVRDLPRLESLLMEKLPASEFEQLRGMRLRDLTFATTDELSLEPLRGMPLEKLNIRARRVVDLAPLTGMPLRHLTAMWSGLETLEPLRGLPLTHLHIQGNRLTSLEPLRDIPLRELYATKNPFGSLAPFLEVDPPKTFRFDAAALPERELARAAEVWSQKPSTTGHAHTARTILALRTRDAAALQALAREQDGHRYLLSPVQASWAEANALATAVGAHLATITTPAEAKLLALMQAEAGDTYVWVGARANGSPWRWVTGEPWSEGLLPATAPANPQRALAVMISNAVPKPPDWELPFLLEWEPDK